MAQHVIIFSPHSSFDGVDHLINIFLNRLLCRIAAFHFRIHFAPSPFSPSRLRWSPRCGYPVPSYPFSWKPTRHRKASLPARKRGPTGIWTADPWSGNLLCWPLDHATPPSIKGLAFILNWKRLASINSLWVLPMKTLYYTMAPSCTKPLQPTIDIGVMGAFGG